MSVVHDEIRERCAALAEEVILSFREGVFFARLELRPERADVHEPIVIRVRQRPQHDAIEQRENRRGGAESEGEREDDDERERRCARETAHGVPRLAANGVEEFHTVSPLEHGVVDRTCFVSIRLEVAEATARFAFGVGAREAFALYEVLSATLQMKTQLVVDGVAQATPCVREPEHSADATPSVADHRAAPVPRAFTTRPTTSVYCDQRAISSARCLRPFVVRR